MPEPGPAIDPQRLFVLRVLLAFTCVGGGAFAVLNAWLGHYPLASLEVLVAALSGWLFIRLPRSRRAGMWLGLYLVLFLAAVLLAAGSTSSAATAFVWVLLVPFVAHPLLGRRTGLWVSTAFLLAAGALFLLRLQAAGVALDPLAAANVIACAVLQLGLSYAYEAGRERSERRLRHLAATDPLTGLPNRLAMEEALGRRFLQARRTDRAFAVLSIDLDDFKAVNDRLGHEAGDSVLTRFAQLLGARLRHEDLPSRWGGEEFLVLLPGTDRAGAGRVAEMLRQTVAAAALPGRDPDTPLTASIGVAVCPEDACEPAALLVVADRRLYRAKALGRNRVEATSGPPSSVTDRTTGPASGSANAARLSHAPGFPATH